MTYAERVADAIASQDYRAMTALLVELSGKVDRADAADLAALERRARRAEQKREERRRMSQVVARHDATDSDNPSPPSPSLLSPTPPINPSASPAPLEHSEKPQASENVQVIALALSAAAGERIGDVKRFLLTRRPETRAEWMRQMLRLIGPGSQFTADDLGDACSDALALDEPIAGPHALRVFVAKQREGRHSAPGSSIAGRIAPAEAKALRERELREEKTRRDDERRYREARNIAVARWTAEHTAESAALRADVERKLTATVPRGQQPPAWVVSAIGEMHTAKVATAAGFPDFDTWRKTKGAA